jgi:hypothetical protein
MSKTYIVSMGYSYLGTESKEVAIGLLEAKVLNQEYVKEDNCYIYIPEEKDITIKVVDSSLIRPLSNKEKENKAVSAAESTASYYKGEAENHKKEIEELKGQIRLLAKKTEE